MKHIKSNHNDHLGSSTYLTDKNGGITTRYEYLPYGELMRESSYQNLSSEITTRYRFSGKEYDEVSKPFEPKYWLVAQRNRTQAPQRLSEERAVRGYYYFGARYYDPRISQWLSVDPLASQFPNKSPYNYCSGNPINRIDPTGMVETDFLNSETGETIHVEDGKDQIAVIDNKQFEKIKSLASANAWDQSQSQQYENIINSSSLNGMNSDLGLLSRLTYAEMSIGNDNAKAIVAESAINRLKRPYESYENPDGTLQGVINKKGAYDVTSPKSHRNDEYLNPFTAVEKGSISSSFNQKEWLSSIKAAYNAINGSNIGKGTIFYHSASSTYRDNSPGYIKINLNINHRGIKGTWGLK